MLCSFLLGVWFAYERENIMPLFVGVCCVVLLQAGILVFLQFFSRSRVSQSEFQRARLFPQTILLAALLFLTGVVRVSLVQTPTSLVCEKRCSFAAVVESSATKSESTQKFVVRPLVDGVSTMVLVTAPVYPEFAIGSTVLVQGVVEAPQSIVPHNGGTSFDYKSYLLVHSVGSVTYFPNIELIDSRAHTLVHALGRFKESNVASLRQYLIGNEALLASGMLFGDAAFPVELTKEFRASGLSHVVVLSGFNIAILISTVFFLLSIVPLVIRVVASLGFVTLFVMMVGAEVSVMRAVLMACISLLAVIVGRGYVAKQALCITLFAVVLYHPFALLHDASLHLSFLATAGILYLVPIFNTLFPESKFRSLRELFVTTCAAYIATLPYIAFAFGSVSVYALLSNMVVLPFVGVGMLLSFLVVVCAFFSTSLALGVALLCKLILSYMLWVAHAVSSLPFATLALKGDVHTVIVMYIGICLFVYLCSRKNNSEHSVRLDEVHLSDNRNATLSGVVSY
jgi:competence protein ComEC